MDGAIVAAGAIALLWLVYGKKTRSDGDGGSGGDQNLPGTLLRAWDNAVPDWLSDTAGNMANGIAMGNLYDLGNVPGDISGIFDHTITGAFSQDPAVKRTEGQNAYNDVMAFAWDITGATGIPLLPRLGIPIIGYGTPLFNVAWSVTGDMADAINGVDNTLGLTNWANKIGSFFGIKIGGEPAGIPVIESGHGPLAPIVGPGGKNPYSYDQADLPLDPNGQPYLPPDYGIVRDGKAYLQWSTPAIYDPNIGSLADADPARYIPAFTPAGFNTSQGYYDTVMHRFVSAFGDQTIKTFSDVNTWHDNPENDNAIVTIPGFNAPMDGGIDLPVQDPSPTIINAPSTFKEDFWATHKMIRDENGNMITVPR